MPSRRAVLRGVAAAAGGATAGTGIATGSRGGSSASTETPDWRTDDDDEPDLYDWRSVSDGHLVVEHLPGYASTARETLATLAWVRDYVDDNLPHSLSGDVFVSLCPSKEIMAMEFGGARGPRALVGTSGGRILMLDPHYFGPCGDRYVDLEDPRRNPFVQTLVHEYSHVPFYNKLFGKEGYRDTPRWLSQGIGDYLARQYRPNYIAAVDAAVAEGTWDFEQRPYYWGLFLGEYMYGEYSGDQVAALLESTAGSFDAAMKAVFGVSYGTFTENAKAYLRERFAEPVEPSTQAELDECTPGSSAGGSGPATATTPSLTADAGAGGSTATPTRSPTSGASGTSTAGDPQRAPGFGTLAGVLALGGAALWRSLRRAGR